LQYVRNPDCLERPGRQDGVVATWHRQVTARDATPVDAVFGEAHVALREAHADRVLRRPSG
jgi:hypothetical protein